MINLYDHSLQPTRLETPLQILFQKCSGRKECSNISKISKRFPCKTTLFFNVASLQFRNFRRQQNQIQRKKYFLWLFSYIVANLPEKRPIMKPFYESNRITMLNLHASEKNRFIYFPEDAQKSCRFENFRKILEKRL